MNIRQHGSKVWWGLALGGLLLAGSSNGQPNGFKSYEFFLLNTAGNVGGPPSRGPQLTVRDNPPTPFCAQGGFELPGQAWTVDLSAGGITLQAGRYLSIQPRYQTVFPGLPMDSGPAQVRVLVIDHFGTTDLLLDEDDSFATPPRKVSVRHGALVVAHMRALLESAGYRSTLAFPLRYTRNNRTVTIQPMNLDASTGKISAGDTRSLVSKLSGSAELQPTTEDLIINMSFAMVPCGLLENYRTLRERALAKKPPQRYTFKAYLADLAAVNRPGASPQQREAFVKTLFTTVPPGDPLWKWLSQVQATFRQAERRAVAVAASGNYGLPFSTMPGAWATVLSVGATNTQGQPPGLPPEGNWSDAGDVTAIGEWYRLPQAQLVNLCRSNPATSCVTSDLLTNPAKYTQFGYRGTSFAAPSVAVALAMQIRPGTCFPLSGTGYAPVTAKGGNLPWKTLGC